MIPHPEYLKLGLSDSERQQAYRQLFQTAISDADLTAIRDGSHEGWALGSERFKEQVEALGKRRAVSKGQQTDEKPKSRLTPKAPSHRSGGLLLTAGSNQ